MFRNEAEEIKWAIRVMAGSIQVNEQADAAKRILIGAADRYRSTLEARKERVIPFVDGEPHEI